MVYDSICPDCASKDIKVMEDDLCKCEVCGLFFDLEDTPMTEKIIRQRPRKKYNEEEEDAE